MVRSVDGSFVPLSFVSRAPGELVVPVALKNNKDLSYLVSSHRSTGVISEVDHDRLLIDDCPHGLVFVARISPLAPAQPYFICDRYSSSGDSNGPFSFAELYICGISSGR